jgi:hypothetical protein
MKKFLILLMAVVFGTTLAFGAMAGEKGKDKDAKPSGMKERTVTKTATVQAIDLDKRVVTLKGEKGNVFDLKVGKRQESAP